MCSLINSQDAATKGKIFIPGNSQISPCADKPHCWRLTTPEVPTGMLIRAPNAKEKRSWITAINAAINSQRSKKLKHTDDLVDESVMNPMDLV